MFRRRYKLIILSTIVLAVVLGFGAQPALAQNVLKDLWTAISNPIDSFLLVIGGLIYMVIMAGAQLLTVLTEILIWVASYNNFINEPIVNVGWVIVRDLANMVFIVALLYMAFNMVFGIKGKAASLLTLIINAGLINFSKTIAGLFIDVSQVVMLTFVNAFYNIAAGNLLDALGLTKIFTYRNAVEAILQGDASVMALVGTLVVALVMVYVALGVVLTIIIVLIGRIFQLWGLLIFAPLPWVARLVPAIGYVGGRWWEKLGQYCVSGPVLAFYLWLAFTAVDLYSKGLSVGIFGDNPGRGAIPLGSDVKELPEQAAGLTQAMSITNILSFMVIIGILMLALQQANQFGIATAGFAAKVRKTGHKWTMKGLRGGGKLLGEHTPVGFGLGRLATKLGFEKTGKLLSTGIAPGWRAAKDLAKEKFQILDKEKREQKRKLRTQGAREALYDVYADVVEHKPSTEHTFRTTTLLGQASGEAEKLDKDGLLQGQGQSQHQLDVAIRRGQEARAIGIAMHMAEKGWGDPEDMMKRIKERFKTGDKAETLILHRMEQKAGRAENANKYAAPALSASREDLDTGEITRADKATRIADAKELMDRATFDELDDAFASDRRTMNFKRVANDKEEVEVRMGVIGGWATRVQAEADNLNDPVQRRKWLSRWGSEARRKQVAAQLRTAVGIANKNGVIVEPAKKEAIENMARLFELDNNDLYSERRNTTTGKVERTYNISKVLKSATTPGTTIRVQKHGATTTRNKVLTDQVFDQGATGGRVTDTGPAVLTDAAQRETDKFYTSVLAQEEKMMRTADDRPTTNDAEIDKLLRNEAKMNATARANLVDQLNRIQKVQRLITDGRAKSDADLSTLHSQITSAQKSIRATLAGITTDIIDPASGNAITADVAFDSSNLNDRFRLFAQNVQSYRTKAAATGPYTPDRGESRTVDKLAAGIITPLDRSLNRRKEKQYIDDRSTTAGNTLLDRGLGALTNAKNTDVLDDRVRQLEQARAQVLAAINRRSPFLRGLQKKYRNDPSFKDEMNNVITRLNSLNFSVPTQRSDAEIEKVIAEVSRLRNKYVK